MSVNNVITFNSTETLKVDNSGSL